MFDFWSPISRLNYHTMEVFSCLLQSSVTPNMASSLPNTGISFRVMFLQTHRYIKQTFPFFERGSPFVNEFASVLRKMEYWEVAILALERRLQSPVTKSEG